MKTLDTLIAAERRTVEPTNEDRERVRAKLMGTLAGAVVSLSAGMASGASATTGGVSTAAASTVASGAATTAALSPSVLMFKAAGSLLLAGAVVAGSYSAMSTTQPQLTSPRTPTITSSQATAPARSSVASIPSPIAPSPLPIAPPSRTAKAARHEAAKSRPAMAGELAKDIERLRAVSSALSQAEPERALKLIDERPPGKSSDLEPELRAARIVALCRAGRTEEGARSASQFLSQHSQSPLRGQIEVACGTGARTKLGGGR